MPPALGIAFSDWLRRSRGAAAIIGTDMAAPECTALTWRWVKPRPETLVIRLTSFQAAAPSSRKLTGLLHST
jgi:hypothetical protein